MERVKSSDVLDPTHEVIRTFSALLLGTFRRVGPNSWDDYEFQRSSAAAGVGRPPGPSQPDPSQPDPSQPDPSQPDLDKLEVGVLLPVQLEPRGCEVRYRASGRVQRVRFLPTAEDLALLEKELGEPFDPRAHARTLRKYFESMYLRPRGAESALGAAAVIVDKLREK